MIARPVTSWIACGALLCITVCAFAQSNATVSATATAAEVTTQVDQAAGSQDQNKQEQDKKAGETSDQPVIENRIRVGFLDHGDGQIEKMVREQDEHIAKLRKQLADPKQARQIRLERVRQAREQYPDVVRVLRLDGKAEEQLFTTLADTMLTQELQRSPFGLLSSPTDYEQGNRDLVQRITQRMSRIAKAIGAARLDDFVDYERSLTDRARIEQFDGTLPIGSKLTGEQKDAMVPLLQERQRRSYGPFREPRPPTQLDFSLSQAELERRNRISTLALNEQSALDAEIADRELLQSLGSILDPQQLQAFARLKQQELETHRTRTRQLRRELGIAPDEKLESPYEDAPLPPLSTSVSLTLRIGVDGELVDKTLLSAHGAPVSVELPQGLLLEVRPLRYVEQLLMLEIHLYELVRGGRRLISQSASSVPASEKPMSALTEMPGNPQVAQGRKGYLITYQFTAATL